MHILDWTSSWSHDVDLVFAKRHMYTVWSVSAFPEIFQTHFSPSEYVGSDFRPQLARFQPRIPLLLFPESTVSKIKLIVGPIPRIPIQPARKATARLLSSAATKCTFQNSRETSQKYTNFPNSKFRLVATAAENKLPITPLNSAPHVISTDKGLSTRRTRLVDFLVAWVGFLVYPTSSRLGVSVKRILSHSASPFSRGCLSNSVYSRDRLCLLPNLGSRLGFSAQG